MTITAFFLLIALALVIVSFFRAQYPLLQVAVLLVIVTLLAPLVHLG